EVGEGPRQTRRPFSLENVEGVLRARCRVDVLIENVLARRDAGGDLFALAEVSPGGLETALEGGDLSQHGWPPCRGYGSRIKPPPFHPPRLPSPPRPLRR